MSVADNLDETKIVEAALAILSLSAYEDHNMARVWKNIDWDLMNKMYERGWISNPKSKAKSVILTEEGEAKAAEFLSKYFGKKK